MSHFLFRSKTESPILPDCYFQIGIQSVRIFLRPGIFSLLSGRVPPVHRGPAAAREVLCVHVVQPAGGQEEVLQEAREEDVPRGGAQVQGGAHGESDLLSAM